jgi:pimeloyl-ACP methyl ester carboxylesterase
MNTVRSLHDIQYVTRPEGRIAFVVTGEGPLVVLVPGMGDLRSTWHAQVGPLAAAGYRTAVLDLRGHGDSDTTFTEHGDVVSGQDVLALVDQLGGPAVLVGNSMGAAAVAWAAAECPDLVAGLVLVSPMLRERGVSSTARALNHLLYRVLFARPWGAAVWATYYRRVLSRGATTPWLDEHVRDVRAALHRPGRLRSFRHLAIELDHAPVEARLGEVTAPVLAFVGSLDPDYPDPAAELAWVAQTLHAEGVPVPDVAHYPQHQAPEVVVPATLAFLGDLPRAADVWATPAPQRA